MKAISAVLLVLTVATTAPAQIEEARQAMERSDNVGAVRILSDALANNPTAEVYLTLGTVYDRMKDFRREEDILKEGAQRYPQDPRFHNQLADLALENNDRETAKVELHRALERDPNNSYPSNLLPTIYKSEGEVQSALRSLNRSGRPVINDILHNYYLSFGSWVVRKAVAFHPSGVLRYSEWKTTESRLLETDNFANVGLEIEPTPIPDHYNAVVGTTTKPNGLGDFAFNLFKGLPFQTNFFDVWNIGNTGINFNSAYRWQAVRRRFDSLLQIPVPFPGLLHLELGDTWRREQWNLSPNVLPQYLGVARFLYDANILRVHLKQIPYYRFDIGGGLDYFNRAASGNIPQLDMNSENVGKFSVETNLRLFDSRYQNRLHLEGFTAQQSILGNITYTGGVAELNNRVTLSRDNRAYLDWTLNGGTAGGNLPVEDYFVLGLDTRGTRNPLRGHAVSDHGVYGRGPMGTDFVLVNTGVERRIATVPFFNTFNIPFVTVKWEVFLDGAKTWDRQHVFKEGKLWIDTGGGLRFATPTQSMNFIYGRWLRDGSSIFIGYVERRVL